MNIWISYIPTANEEVTVEKNLAVKDATRAFMKRKLEKIVITLLSSILTRQTKSWIREFCPRDLSPCFIFSLSTWKLSRSYRGLSCILGWGQVLVEVPLRHVILLTESQFARSAEAYTACSPRTFAFSARTKALSTETNLSHVKS